MRISLILALTLLATELLPARVIRAGRADGDLGISSTFAMALVITGPIGMAVGLRAIVSLMMGWRAGSTSRRMAVEAGRWSLAMLTARVFYALLTRHSILGTDPQMLARDIPGALVAAAVLFAVHHALNMRRSFDDVRRRRGQQLVFELSTSGLLLAFAPVVVATVDITVWLLPLLLLPIATIRKSAALATERERQAVYDALTGLPNRALLQQRATVALADAGRTGSAVAVMLLDLDHFKEINDTLGHRVGDNLLRAVGERLAGAVRETDVVARLGGDEFGILTSCMNSADDAVVLAERLLSVLREPFFVDGVRLQSQASIGIAVSPDHGRDVETLVQRADVALYTAKEERGCWSMYSPEADRYTPERLAMLGELRAGLETGQLVVFYQPKSDAKTGVVVGVEALARWQHPTRGLLPPDEFIPLAENTGLIGDLTFEVLRQALAQVRTWHRKGMQIGVSVNLSVRQLTDMNLPRDVAALLADFHLPASVLTLEVTETTIMADPSRTLNVLRMLADIGIDLSIDDFGTGYSSLAYLRRLQADELKIDKSFVMGMSRNSNDAVIVRSTIELGHNLGLRMVAEGVEDAETWHLLRNLGCDVVQGYHLSRPLPPQQITEWLSDRKLRVALDPQPLSA
ncbi:MAG TPA: EAL domain-containing protein [Mycobacteriales bacterium]|jgi:diguanylate cyclase (GGDEF)-like protein|nr:EAL domain-containing protein [Mycobacteriales bacterium]